MWKANKKACFRRPIFNEWMNEAFGPWEKIPPR